jgi:predicted molibdopterin-dependent oxidoreductase YjgC
VTIDTKENQIVRMKPRHNSEVNSYWMCDYGRKHLVMTNRGVRAEVPMIRDGDKLRATDWETAISWVAKQMGMVGQKTGSAVISPQLSNEDLSLLWSLLNWLQIGKVEFQVPSGETAALPSVPKLKLRADRVPNAFGLEVFGAKRVQGLSRETPGSPLVVMGDLLQDFPGKFGLDASFFLYLGTRLPEAARNAHAILPIVTFTEMDGTFTNFEGRVQRFHQALNPPGIARPGWMVISRILAELGRGDVISDVRSAFDHLVKNEQAFEGLSWDGIGLKGAPVRGGHEEVKDLVPS